MKTIIVNLIVDFINLTVIAFIEGILLMVECIVWAGSKIAKVRAR